MTGLPTWFERTQTTQDVELHAIMTVLQEELSRMRLQCSNKNGLLAYQAVVLHVHVEVCGKIHNNASVRGCSGIDAWHDCITRGYDDTVG